MSYPRSAWIRSPAYESAYREYVFSSVLTTAVYGGVYVGEEASSKVFVYLPASALNDQGPREIVTPPASPSYPSE